MTVSTTENRKEYACNGVTTAFNFPYRFLANADLKVILVTTATGAETTLTLDTDYTVSGAGGAAGGTVTTATAYANTHQLVIYRDPAITQGLALVENDPLPAEEVEEAFDRLTLIDQRDRELVRRSFRLPEGDTGFSAADLMIPPKAERAGMVFAFDANGKPTVAEEASGHSSLRADIADGSADVLDFAYARTGTYVSGTEFTIEGTPVDAVNRKLAQVDRRVIAVGDTTGVIYGTITGVAEATNTTVTVSWDSGSLANEVLTVHFGVLTPEFLNAKADKVSSATADNLASLDADGNPQDAGIAAAEVATKSAVAAITGAFRNLTITNNNTNPNHQVDIAADELVVKDSSGRSVLLENVAITVDITVSGAGGLSTSVSEAANTWYSIWVISNGTTVAGLLATSTTAPTLPSGYTYKALVGAVRNDGSSNFVAFSQVDRHVIYTVERVIASGGFATSAWTGIAVTGFFPPTAKSVTVLMASQLAHIGLSPRSDGLGGEYNSSNNAGANETYGGIFTTAQSKWAVMRVLYAGTLYYFTTSASSQMVAIGWEY